MRREGSQPWGRPGTQAAEGLLLVKGRAAHPPFGERGGCQERGPRVKENSRRGLRPEPLDRKEGLGGLGVLADHTPQTTEMGRNEDGRWGHGGLWPQAASGQEESESR